MDKKDEKKARFDFAIQHLTEYVFYIFDQVSLLYQKIQLTDDYDEFKRNIMTITYWNCQLCGAMVIQFAKAVNKTISYASKKNHQLYKKYSDEYLIFLINDLEANNFKWGGEA